MPRAVCKLTTQPLILASFSPPFAVDAANRALQPLSVHEVLQWAPYSPYPLPQNQPKKKTNCSWAYCGAKTCDVHRCSWLTVCPDSDCCVVLQLKGVLPESAVKTVKELLVPASHAEAAKQEAANLPTLDINKVCMCLTRSWPRYPSVAACVYMYILYTIFHTSQIYDTCILCNLHEETFPACLVHLHIEVLFFNSLENHVHWIVSYSVHGNM